MCKFLNLIFFTILVALNSCSKSSPTGLTSDTTDFVIISRSFNDSRKVYKVNSNGTLEQIEIQTDRGGSSKSGIGSNSPLPTLDYSHIAYIKNLDLWSYEISTGISQQVTFVAQPPDSIFAAINIFITGWSLNGQKLLYHVTPGEELNCHECDRTWEQREADYGHHVYDFGTRKHEKVDLDGEYEDWIYDETILVQNRSPHTISKYSPTTQTNTLLATLEHEISQTKISRDGTWMAAAFLDWSNGLTQIIKMNLLTNDLIQITNFERWGEVQSPSLSPDSEKTSYSQLIRDSVTGQREKYNLMVDDEVVHECDYSPRTYWITNEIIVAYCSGEITVIDIESKEVIAKHNL